VTSEEICTDIVHEQIACCTNPDRFCTICLGENSVGLPDSIVVGFDEDFTCADLDRLASLYTDDQCVDEIGSVAEVNFACWWKLLMLPLWSI
jgi:hypothetical protein